ncbi:heavy metal-binding domain-containing protein [Streptomyces sp. NBC_00454]|uniref:heavy metal-binding domain-containing protein n=1 Tax=Streptomyces sp. NBC_00454 TaxID=2975747 RepID=UPI003249FA5A
MNRRDGAPPGNPGGTWDSTLSSGEFAAVRSVGFDPVGQVLGTAVFNIGYTGLWACPGAWTAADGTERPTSRWAPSLSPMVSTLYTARRLALSRAVAECRELGGDGIVGVDLQVGGFTAGMAEFTVLGTAVRARSRIRPRTPFTSHLRGQDFAKLLNTGWVPTGLAFGIAMETRHDDWRTFGRGRWAAANQEIEGYTQLIGRARQGARSQLALDAAKHGGDGVVVDEVELKVRENECANGGSARDLVAEAVLVGTTIARFDRPRQSAGPAPLTIMRLEREH